MPFEHVWRHRSIYKRFFGSVTAQEFLLSIKLTQGDARFDSLKYTLNDFTDATLPLLTREQIVAFAAPGIGAAYTNRNIQIVVITADPVAQAEARDYARLAPFPLHVFPNRHDANAWLPADQHIPDPPIAAPL